MTEKIMNTQNLYALLDVEPYFILSALVLLSWIFYKTFLGDLSDERHLSLKRHYRNLLHHFLVLSTLFASFILITQSAEYPSIGRTLPYVALATFIWGMIVFTKTCRLIILQYLFLGSMRHGVPLLIVNIFSLLLSIGLGFWGASHIFNVQLAPLVATSAAVSVILGLAMQDTLGNLFAGISLQVDKSFDIGDWVEIRNGLVLTAGQISEITWRATTLVGWSDERIVIPNRVLSNSQIANFSLSEKPILRSQLFRVSYQTEIEKAKAILINSLKELKDLRTWPEPLVLITETNEHWVGLKLIYYIDNYGSQFGIADSVIERALNELHRHGIQTASERLELRQSEAIPS